MHGGLLSRAGAGAFARRAADAGDHPAWTRCAAKVQIQRTRRRPAIPRGGPASEANEGQTIAIVGDSGGWTASHPAVALQLVGVTDLSKVVDNFALALPCEGKQPRAVMRLGAWINRHLTMIAEAMPAAAADVSTLQGDFSPTTGNV